MEPQSSAPAPPWDPELAQYLAELQSFTPLTACVPTPSLKSAANWQSGPCHPSLIWNTKTSFV